MRCIIAAIDSGFANKITDKLGTASVALGLMAQAIVQPRSVCFHKDRLEAALTKARVEA